ncbi:MAG: site-specific integrase [Candidatus Devosia phytovorans]|uniref:Site-specific integrase n=1 Tax=Candidatus Devosia phytovorans TaxID=3121372 RepID=A0AAJ5VR83_9HYPH|nr:site-specific integrase [Devosia sp.]WEK03281.1 MAG: site-specific integrase [Devosia sp.]
MARHRGKLWQADIRTADGIRLRPTFKTESAAMAWEKAARAAVVEGRPLPPANNTSRGTGSRDLTLLGKLFDHVSRTEWATMKAATTLIRNGQVCMDHFGRNKAVATITSADIADFRVTLAESGLAQPTINRKCSALSKMLNVAWEAGALDAVPKFRWTREEQTKFRYMDDIEERAVLAFHKAQGWDDLHDLTILLVDTGARCFSEMLPVRWDAFGPHLASVTFWHTKSGKPRTVPLTKRAREIVKARRITHGPLNGPFSGLNKNTMRSRWDAMRATTGLADLTPHTMRHTCCTRLVLGGVDIKRVMQWMGHDAIATTMRYMQVRPTDLEDVLRVLEGSGAGAA